MIRTPLAAAALLFAVILPVVVALRIAPPPEPTPGAEDLPDFTAIAEPRERRDRFVAYMEPVVDAAQAEVREQRQRLATIAQRWRDDGLLLRRDERWLAQAARRYRVDGDGDDIDGLLERLERRIDTVPRGLAVAQAGIESGWGQSRFAREGNNLFGEWCFEPGCGMVPAQRPDSAQHEVRTFATVQAAMRSYLNNLNSHRAYGELRDLRAEARAQGREPGAEELAAGLRDYSQRGEAYVHEVRVVIRGLQSD